MPMFNDQMTNMFAKKNRFTPIKIIHYDLSDSNSINCKKIQNYKNAQQLLTKRLAD